jgi:cephalosporin-C deacetylase-like acetyl esterase
VTKACIALAVFGLTVSFAQQPAAPRQQPPNAEFEALQAHFERVVERRQQQLLNGITTAEQWEQRKPQIRVALERSLWHDRTWPATPPPATVTHTEERPGYKLENLVIETAPKLFLTANLYLPREGQGPYPVVLYQCGHASKTYYARHGAWFAAHGIAALVMDNIEMGEVETTHHGVYAHAWFHWYSRGFSPLAVELLNAKRAVDYLASRPDLDRTRIGATGRSGGGTTTFFLAALDERIKASAPVSGTLSTNGWVKKRLSFAHCDCQYPVNMPGLLYAEVGALIAPRAQLQCNADTDPGFPMDAFEEMVSKIGDVYDLYQARDALQTAVTPGGHSDTEEIRLPVYSFFLKQLLGVQDPVTAEGPVDAPEADALMCFRNGLPVDERLSRIDEELIPLATFSPRALESPQARTRRTAELTALLRSEVFHYFPANPAALDAEWGEKSLSRDRSVESVTFTGFEGLRVKATLSRPASAGGKLPALIIADHRRGIPVWGNEQPIERNQWGARAVLTVETLDRGSRALERNLRSFSDDDPVHHMRRQAMVAGTTIESMQVYELLRAVELLRMVPDIDAERITITGKGEMGVNAMYAALLDGGVARVVLHSPPASHRQGPPYLSVLRYTDIAEVAMLFGNKLSVYGETPATLASIANCGSPQRCLVELQ